jgi:hypothetical protein
MAATVVLAVLAAVRYWRAQPSRWRRVLAAVAASAICACVVLSRVNIYEKMFHPVDQPEFIAASTSNLDGAEKVLAVHIGDADRAYPIRSISYHHVVNDQVGGVPGVPIVATY